MEKLLIILIINPTSQIIHMAGLLLASRCIAPMIQWLWNFTCRCVHCILRIETRLLRSATDTGSDIYIHRAPPSPPPPLPPHAHITYGLMTVHMCVCSESPVATCFYFSALPIPSIRVYSLVKCTSQPFFWNVWMHLFVSSRLENAFLAWVSWLSLCEIGWSFPPLLLLRLLPLLLHFLNAFFFIRFIHDFLWAFFFLSL